MTSSIGRFFFVGSFSLGSLAVPLLPAVAQSAKTVAGAARWAGTYHYTESYPGAGGSRIILHHTLRVSPKGSGLSAVLHSEGYQDPGTTLLCRAQADAAHLTLLFVSYAGGKRVNQYGVAVYKPGDPLLTLRYSRRGGYSHPLTVWRKYQNNPGHSGAVAFVRNR